MNADWKYDIETATAAHKLYTVYEIKMEDGRYFKMKRFDNGNWNVPVNTNLDRFSTKAEAERLDVLVELTPPA